jgi:hypothetical protein
MENKKQIKDVEGKEHEYSIQLHPAEDALELMPKILTIISTVVGPGVDIVSKNKEALTSGSWLDSDIDGDQISKAITMLASAFITSGGTAFVKELLRFTTREYNGSFVKVSDKMMFNQIYSGNYGELVAAITFALKVNFLPSLRASLEHKELFQKINSL